MLELIRQDLNRRLNISINIFLRADIIAVPGGVLYLNSHHRSIVQKVLENSSIARFFHLPCLLSRGLLISCAASFEPNYFYALALSSVANSDNTSLPPSAALINLTCCSLVILLFWANFEALILTSSIYVSRGDRPL